MQLYQTAASDLYTLLIIDYQGFCTNLKAEKIFQFLSYKLIIIRVVSINEMY